MTEALIMSLFIPCLSIGQSNPGNLGTANLKMWLKANDAAKLISAANLVSSWSTTFPTATPLNYTQSINANKPTYSANNINFNPSLTSSGSAYLLSSAIPLASTSSNFTILSVNYATSHGTVFIQPWATLGGSNPVFYSDAAVAFSNSQSIAGAAVSMNVPTITGATRTVGATNTTMTNYMNSLQSSSNSTLALPALDALGSSCIIGRWQNGALTTPLTGGLAELIIYDRVLNANELSRANSYLAIKYGITLGTATSPVTYQNSAGTTSLTGIVWTASTTYQHNVAGIGRDDNSGLNQKQSKSNTSAIITMALLPAGAAAVIPTANASNTNTFSTDLSFLTWGDNGLATAGVVTDLPATIVQKSGRIWKTQLTGTGMSGQNIRVKIDMTAFGNVTFGTFANYRLLLDADGIFASGATILSPVTGSVAGRTVEFDVPISSYANYYMTIGTTNLASPLPIELTAFSANCNDATVKIDWSTASEFNNLQFDISRSNDAFTWETVSIVKSKGNSNMETNYSISDVRPLKGISYYRLQQTDIDGTTKYFDPVSVSCPSVFSENAVSIFPNPANENFSVSIRNIPSTGYILIELLDMTGRKIFSKSLVASDENTITIDSADIPAGSYLVRVIINDEIWGNQRIVLR